MEAIIEKLDLEKEDHNYYKTGKEPEIRDLDPYYYLTVEGKSSPSSESFNLAIEQVYAVAYNIKFLCKAEDLDFKVPKMEGFWWIDGGLEAQHKFTETPEDEWNWKITIRMPDFVEGDHFYRAIQSTKLKKPELSVEDKVKYELINEGKCVQILHIGSYDSETESIEKIMNFNKLNNLEVAGYHHEIYLSDPRKTPEHKLRTILRYAVN